jgi:dTDP-4-dehydrorhamnose reductase
MKKILILGVSGMLGSTIFKYFSMKPELEVFGTARSEKIKKYFPCNLRNKIIFDVDVENAAKLEALFFRIKPEIVINCIGVIKQLDISNNPLVAIPINALLPHRINKICNIMGSRLIHFSTDCIFSGNKGHYVESDFPDAIDLYGRSKLLGEVNSNNAITLRTSIVGHGIDKKIGLIDWFLSQKTNVLGYRQAIFSGLPAVEIARIIFNFVMPMPNLHGVYHLASLPISKYELLKLVAIEYDKKIKLIDDETVKINRVLNAKKFNDLTGYIPPSWKDLVKEMHDFR